MKVVVVGTGYVGLVSGTCFAEMGHEVTCIDVDGEKIQQLKQGKVPFYEPGLEELLARNQKAGRLHFATDFTRVAAARAVFLAVGTPATESGQANLEYLMAAARAVAEELDHGTSVVIKSTVPVGASDQVRKHVGRYTRKNFYIVSNPEFLREGSAIEDFMKPDRVVIGHREEDAGDCIVELYAPLVRQGHPVYRMSNASAELAKYAANCFLATKISFINDIAKLCEFSGADIEQVREAMISDRRIGKYFFSPGLGYGGSCFPKDIKALLSTAEELGTSLGIVQAAEEVNQQQKILIFEKLRAHLGELADKAIAFWGVAFKPQTDDVRESPAISLANKIIAAGGRVQFYDPVASSNFLRAMGGEREELRSYDTIYQCLEGAQALVLVTEWPEFCHPNWGRVKESLDSPTVFDGRNIYSTRQVLDAGLCYYAIGKSIPVKERCSVERS